MSLPLPPGWTEPMFEVWFKPIFDNAMITYDNYVFLRSPAYLQINVEEYIAYDETTSPLPFAWSMAEFVEWVENLLAEVYEVVYTEILSQIPAELLPAVLAWLSLDDHRLTGNGDVRITADGRIRLASTPGA